MHGPKFVHGCPRATARTLRALTGISNQRAKQWPTVGLARQTEAVCHTFDHHCVEWTSAAGHCTLNTVQCHKRCIAGRTECKALSKGRKHKFMYAAQGRFNKSLTALIGTSNIITIHASPTIVACAFQTFLIKSFAKSCEEESIHATCNNLSSNIRIAQFSPVRYSSHWHFPVE